MGTEPTFTSIIQVKPYFFQEYLNGKTSQRFFNPDSPHNTMVRCLECYNMHQIDKTKEHYFCLKARDYIEHEIDENIGCKGHQPLHSNTNR